MNHLTRMCEGDRVAGLLKDRQQPGQRPGGRGALVEPLEQVGQALALDLLHREIERVLRRQSQLVHGHDVGVLELGGVAGFLEEAGDQLRVIGHLGRDHLDRHVPVGQAVVGPIDHAHPAAVDLVQSLVLQPARAQRRYHLGRQLGGGALRLMATEFDRLVQLIHPPLL